MAHKFSPGRYQTMPYKRCGTSGLQLPAISLGAWMTFGGENRNDPPQKILFRAFNLGITHFDLANNYGDPPGESERIVGRAVKEMPRDELIVSTKAGHLMWPGPYGGTPSRKNLIASLDQSLKRLGLDYVDIFYVHRWVEEVPIEESLGALDTVIRQGKALYGGVSNWPAGRIAEGADIVEKRNWAPITINQPCFNLLWRNKEISESVLPEASRIGAGNIVFSPLAGGLLTDKYLGGKLPKGSRAAKWEKDKRGERLSPSVLSKLEKLNAVARSRGESLAVMSLAWLLRQPDVTSVLIGASRVSQLESNLQALHSAPFTPEELKKLDEVTG